MGFLLDHLPAPLQFIISTRADPALPPARLRARGELVEVRASDLRFTADEATAYLNGVHGLDLTVADVAALETRTEGWIAALQLAALSLHDREDSSAFIAGSAGDDRFVVDYLADQVLDQQGPEVRRFLLETSVLERLTGPLCDAVTGRGGGSALLASLEARNLLIVPLDNRRRWYRYHHLFSDVLQSRLLDERPTDVAELHRRASQWYQQAGEIARGRLHDAHRTVTRALRLAQDHAGQGPVRGSADMLVALSRVTWERGDLVATADHLRRAADLGEAGGLPQQPHRWRVAMAQLRAAQGDAEGAAALLEEADRIYSGVLSPNVRPVAATRVRLLAERETSRQPVRGYEREDCPPPMS